MNSYLKMTRGLAVASLGLVLLAAPMSAPAQELVPRGGVQRREERRNVEGRGIQGLGDYQGRGNYQGDKNRQDACANARKLENQYRNDQATGHPSAAKDVAEQMRTAENRCRGM
jgi:hypothetical protein